MKHTLISSIIAAALASLPLSAVSAQPLPDDKAPFSYFDEDVIRKAMEPKGATIETRARAKGGSLIIVNYEKLKILAVPASCREGTKKCIGLGLVVLFNPSDALSKAQFLEFINDFNRRNDFIKVILNKNGAVSVMRYTIADHGNVLGNLRSDFVNLVVLAKRYDQELQKYVREIRGEAP